MLLISLVIRHTSVGILMSSLEVFLATEAAKHIIRSTIKNRKVMSCPKCKQRLILPRKKGTQRRMSN